MLKAIVWNGKVERYYTENNSHQFEVSRMWNGRYNCDVNWAGRTVITTGGNTRIEAIQNALTRLQQTAYKLPFATYRMADILTGQI